MQCGRWNSKGIHIYNKLYKIDKVHMDVLMMTDNDIMQVEGLRQYLGGTENGMAVIEEAGCTKSKQKGVCHQLLQERMKVVRRRKKVGARTSGEEEQQIRWKPKQGHLVLHRRISTSTTC